RVVHSEVIADPSDDDFSRVGSHADREAQSSRSLQLRRARGAGPATPASNGGYLTLERRRAGAASRELEVGIAAGHHFFAFTAVARRAAGIEQDHPLVPALDVAIDTGEPRIGLGDQQFVGDLYDVVGPRGLGLRAR